MILENGIPQNEFPAIDKPGKSYNTRVDYQKNEYENSFVDWKYFEKLEKTNYCFKPAVTGRCENKEYCITDKRFHCNNENVKEGECKFSFPF